MRTMIFCKSINCKHNIAQEALTFGGAKTKAFDSDAIDGVRQGKITLNYCSMGSLEISDQHKCLDYKKAKLDNICPQLITVNGIKHRCIEPINHDGQHIVNA
jgi:hypothetical protein